jgi:hypothetical protein
VICLEYCAKNYGMTENWAGLNYTIFQYFFPLHHMTHISTSASSILHCYCTVTILDIVHFPRSL